jgi:hypothetical protein
VSAADEVHGPPCPKCGAESPMPILYGLPGPELGESAARGELVLGGCIIRDDNPEWQCRACGEQYGASEETRAP